MKEWINEENRIYLKDENNNILASVDFVAHDNIYDITHTNVDPSCRHQGLAGKLMLKMIDKAKKDDFKINPVCSYAVSFFDRFDKYNYLLAND